MKRASAIFTAGVDYLRSRFSNEHVRELMALVWDLVGRRLVPLMSGPKVATLGFAALNGKQGRIYLPEHWSQMTVEDPVHELGAQVFCGSQAVDCWNERLDDLRAVRQRAIGYEVEFLLTMQRENADWKPNVYQSQLLEAYPLGLKTPALAGLLYKSSPVSSSRRAGTPS